MKKTLIISTLLFSLAPLAALASCESVKAEIAQRLLAMACRNPVLSWKLFLTIRFNKPVVKWLGIVRMIHRKLFIPASPIASNLFPSLLRRSIVVRLLY